MKSSLLAFWVPVLMGALLAVAAADPPQSPPAAQTPEVGDQALRWERDFDLLLDLQNVPSPADLVRQARIEELKNQRRALRAHLADLQGRWAALQGTYTTETLLNEMLRQGVPSLQEVQKNLKDEMDQTTAKIQNLDDKLRRLGVPRGE